MAKAGKKYAEAVKAFDQAKLYDAAEAIDILKNWIQPNLMKPLNWLSILTLIRNMRISRCAVR